MTDIIYNNFFKAFNNSKLTIEQAAAQAFIFFLAGFETTSTTISFALFEMAQNQEIQQKAREEVVKLWRKHSEINYDSVMEMHYLDTVIFGSLPYFNFQIE